MRNQITRLTAVAVTALLVSLTPMASAHAAVERQGDKRGDAPARFDITRTIANNAEKRVTVKIKVKNLRKAPAVFGFLMAPAGTNDFAYTATARRKRDGRVIGTLRQDVSHVQTERVECNVNARWVMAKDLVRISFPQACLEFVGKASFYAYVSRPGADLPVDETSWFNVRHN